MILAEAKSMYSEVLIIVDNRKWLDHAINAATGNASSSILCDCEAGLDRYVGPVGDESVSTGWKAWSNYSIHSKLERS